jgi:uncharacterized membrane protein SirB2
LVLDYPTLKVVHVSAVALSGAGFIARGVGAWRGAAWTRSRGARSLPHLIDTVLLLSALGMLWIAHLSPWAVLWLRAKIVGLVCYIGLGVVALRGLRRRGPPVPRGARVPWMARGSWVLALLVFAYIVSVALTKSPWGGFVLLRG